MTVCVDAYIGIPWEELHCWSLVRRVLHEQFGIEAPSYADEYESPENWSKVAATTTRARQCWREVAAGAEQPGDVVLLRMQGQPIHVGIVIVPGDMLHTLKGLGACVENYRALRWRERVLGFYRAADVS
jgi:cell wall-associated NlpC family hydrolase